MIWFEFKRQICSCLSSYFDQCPKIGLTIIKHCAVTLWEALFWPRPRSGSLLRGCWPFESRAVTERLLWLWCYRYRCEARVTTPQHSQRLNSRSECYLVRAPITHYWLDKYTQTMIDRCYDDILKRSSLTQTNYLPGQLVLDKCNVSRISSLLTLSSLLHCNLWLTVWHYGVPQAPECSSHRGELHRGGVCSPGLRAGQGRVRVPIQGQHGVQGPALRLCGPGNSRGWENKDKPDS